MITLKRRNRMVVRLHGSNGTPDFDWAKSEEYQPIDIDLFREKAIGNLRSVKKILSYFEVPDKDIDVLLSDKEYEKEYDNFIVSKTTKEDEVTVSIKFTNTI